MSLAPVTQVITATAETVLPDADADHKGCLICTTSRPPTHAYRPHTLGRDCWCTRDSTGSKVLDNCWVARTFGL